MYLAYVDDRSARKTAQGLRFGGNMGGAE